MIFEKGNLIAFESGEYSDFMFNGMLVSLQDINLKKLAQQYIDEKKLTTGGYHNLDSFLGWLVAKQYCAPAEYSTVYLGSAYFDKEFDVSYYKNDDQEEAE